MSARTPLRRTASSIADRRPACQRLQCTGDNWTNRNSGFVGGAQFTTTGRNNIVFGVADPGHLNAKGQWQAPAASSSSTATPPAQPTPTSMRRCAPAASRGTMPLRDRQRRHRHQHSRLRWSIRLQLRASPSPTRGRSTSGLDGRRQHRSRGRRPRGRSGEYLTAISAGSSRSGVLPAVARLSAVP